MTGIVNKPPRLLESGEIRHRYPPGVLGPCDHCDMGARFQRGEELLCFRHVRGGRLDADTRRSVEARPRRKVRTE